MTKETISTQPAVPEEIPGTVDNQPPVASVTESTPAASTIEVPTTGHETAQATATENAGPKPSKAKARRRTLHKTEKTQNLILSELEKVDGELGDLKAGDIKKQMERRFGMTPAQSNRYYYRFLDQYKAGKPAALTKIKL